MLPNEKKWTNTESFTIIIIARLQGLGKKAWSVKSSLPHPLHSHTRLGSVDILVIPGLQREDRRSLEVPP